MTQQNKEWKTEIEKGFQELLIAILVVLPADRLWTLFAKSSPKTLILVLVVVVVMVAIRQFELLARIQRYRDVRRTGLKGILQRSTDPKMNWLPLLFKAAKSGDAVDIVGRTNEHLLKDWSGLVKGALERGVRIRIMLLSRTSIANPQVGPRTDLRPLGIGDASALLQRDLHYVENELASIRRECLENSWPGLLYVYRTSVLVLNSAVIFTPRSGPLRIIYDFSFGPDKEQKWSHYYQKKKRAGSFTNQLKQFYSSMFDQVSSSLVYDLSYDPVLSVERLATSRMKELIAAHAESESLRQNTLNNLVPAAVHIFRQMNQQNTPPGGPISVQVEVTNRCSTNCKHCSRYKKAPALRSGALVPLPVLDQNGTDGTGEVDLDVALAERLFQDLFELGTKTVTFSGGEPTQHRRFPRLLQAAKSAQLEIGVLSNGIGLTQDVLLALDKNAAWLRLSIDGSNERIYADVRTTAGEDPQGGFNEVKKTLQWFDQRPAERCKLAICYTILKQNVKDVESMIEFIELEFPNFLGRLTFKFAHAGNDGDPESYLCSADEIRELYYSVLQNPRLQKKANISYLRALVELFGTADLAKGTPTRSLYLSNRPQCFTPYLFSVVDPKGDVYPCCFLYEDNRSYNASAVERRAAHVLGNIEQGFKNVWRGDLYRTVRDELVPITPEGKYHACSRCTRHYNHNVWLSYVHQEYEQLRASGHDPDKILNASIDKPKDQIWL